MGKTIVFDTETTGIPIMNGYNCYHSPHLFEYYKDARLIELGYLIFDENNQLIKKKNHLVKPNGFVIENSHIHGISQEMAMANGQPIESIIGELYCDLYDIDTIVSHNIKFDINILLSECFGLCHTYIITKIIDMKKECTMQMGKNFIDYKKNPKLTELYEHLFQKKCKQIHRALSDAEYCAECYLHMIENT